MFFKDIDEVKVYADINASFEFDILTPKLRQVNRDILNLHFGNDFVEEIQTAYDGTTAGNISTLSLADQQIIKKFRAITAPIAVALFITPGQVQIDNAGIFIARNENRATAFEWQIKDLIKSYLRPGYQAIEDAIIFLQKNITSYATYQSSEEFQYSKLCFVPTAKEFTKYYSPLNNSYISYLKMRSCMDKVDEMDIANILLPNYYAELKTKIAADALTVADKAIIPYIKKAIVNLTALKALSELNATFDENGFMIFDNTSNASVGPPKKTALGEPIVRAQESLKTSGEAYLLALKQFLIDNKISYPTFINDPKFVANQSATFNNKAGQGYFAAI